jgi:hypothetical protein
MDGEWLVWGDKMKPLVQGLEDEVKKYVKDHPERNDLYIQDPEGTEYAYDQDTDTWNEC